MGKTTMSEALDEILFEKKPKKKVPIEETKIELEKILEAEDATEKEAEEKEAEKKDKDNEEEEETTENETPEDTVLEAHLKINEDKATVQLNEDDYADRALTDFVAAISLFKTSRKKLFQIIMKTSF